VTITLSPVVAEFDVGDRRWRLVTVGDESTVEADHGPDAAGGRVWHSATGDDYGSAGVATIALAAAVRAERERARTASEGDDPGCLADAVRTAMFDYWADFRGEPIAQAWDDIDPTGRTQFSVWLARRLPSGAAPTEPEDSEQQPDLDDVLGELDAAGFDAAGFHLAKWWRPDEGHEPPEPLRSRPASVTDVAMAVVDAVERAESVIVSTTRALMVEVADTLGREGGAAPQESSGRPVCSMACDNYASGAWQTGALLCAFHLAAKALGHCTMAQRVDILADYPTSRIEANRPQGGAAPGLIGIEAVLEVIEHHGWGLAGIKRSRARLVKEALALVSERDCSHRDVFDHPDGDGAPCGYPLPCPEHGMSYAVDPTLASEGAAPPPQPEPAKCSACGGGGELPSGSMMPRPSGNPLPMDPCQRCSGTGIEPETSGVPDTNEAIARDLGKLAAEQLTGPGYTIEPHDGAGGLAFTVTANEPSGVPDARRWWVDNGEGAEEATSKRAAEVAAADAITDCHMQAVGDAEWPERVEGVAWGEMVVIEEATETVGDDGDADYTLTSAAPEPKGSGVPDAPGRPSYPPPGGVMSAKYLAKACALINDELDKPAIAVAGLLAAQLAEVDRLTQELAERTRQRDHLLGGLSWSEATSDNPMEPTNE